MYKKFLCYLVSILALLLLTATNGLSFGSFGDSVNDACAPAVPYNGNCTLCHVSNTNTGDPTQEKSDYLAGGTTLTDAFCPPVEPDPNLTDSDGDGFTPAEGDCDDNNAAINPDATDIPNNGVDEDCSGADSIDTSSLDEDGDGFTPAGGDCDDTDSAINPGAVENCTDGIDNNCNNLIDAADDNAVGCPVVDNDEDGFTIAEGDCDDFDAAINPDAVENCTDGIDNNCNDLIDNQDPGADGCPPVSNCTDSDGDFYSIEGGTCGPVDCDDNDPAINPGAQEVCSDAIDNDCDSLTDEGCDTACPDQDGDGYQDAACGGADCDDTDPAVNPGSSEICGNAIDENCNGASDADCQICEDGTLVVVKSKKYKKNKGKLYLKGRATKRSRISVFNADTNEILKENIKVRKGKWKTSIRKVGSDLYNITVMTSNGCAVDEVVQDSIATPPDNGGPGNGNDEDDDDDHDHDKDHDKDHHDRNKKRD